MQWDRQACCCTATDSSLQGAWRGPLNGLVRDSVARGACAHRSSVFCCAARLQLCQCQPLDERKTCPSIRQTCLSGPKCYKAIGCPSHRGLIDGEGTATL
ncbi:hypothetical protein QQF64_013665 [Cirrhinus molitorella]|uniref:Uncharacterized protein n=1 Tax=Cirrhinus molitorella TaxID=172907 RepID=A0ABR3LRT8_9TELE